MSVSWSWSERLDSEIAREKTDFVPLRLDKSWDGYTTRFDDHLLDPQTDVYDTFLSALGHGDTTQRRAALYVISNHRPEELFWG